MKKLLILITLLIFASLAGCINEHPVITIPEDVNIINKAISDYEYEPATIDNLEELEIIIQKYNSLEEQYKKHIVNYNVILDNYKHVKELIKENQLIEKSIDDLKKTLLDSLPSSTLNNLQLQKTALVNDEEIELKWISSDPQTIFTNGVVINGRENCNVSLKCIFRYRNKTYEIKKNIIVKPIQFEKLTGNNVFTYMYST